MIKFINYSKYPEIECHVLITRGEYDKTAKVSFYCDRWHANTGFCYEVIKNAIHNAHVDSHTDMNTIIDDFINENSTYHSLYFLPVVSEFDY